MVMPETETQLLAFVKLQRLDCSLDFHPVYSGCYLFSFDQLSVKQLQPDSKTKDSTVADAGLPLTYQHS